MMMKRYLSLLLITVASQASINNPVSFVGQRVLGASPGAPMFIDANSAISMSDQTVGQAFNGAITTTSTVDILMTGLTTSPAFAGTYKVWCISTQSGNTSGAIVYLSVYANGVQDVGSEHRSIPFFASGAGLGAGTSNIAMTGSSIAEVTIAASQAIECRWRTTSGTATSTNRAMIVERK